MAETREIVVPGELVGETSQLRPGQNTYQEGSNIYALRLGVKTIRGDRVNVISLSGRYEPFRGDMVIGTIAEVGPSNWYINIGAANDVGMHVNDVPWRVEFGETSKYLAVGDTVLLKIVHVDEMKKAQVSMKDRQCRKLTGGLIFDVAPTKVPRIVGRNGSMIQLIKDATNVRMFVGQNGHVWLDGEADDVALALEALQKIEAEAHTTGLTDRMKAWLEERRPSANRVQRAPEPAEDAGGEGAVDAATPTERPGRRERDERRASERSSADRDERRPRERGSDERPPRREERPPREMRDERPPRDERPARRFEDERPARRFEEERSRREERAPPRRVEDERPMRRGDDERPARRDERPARRFEEERPARRVDDERPPRRFDDERPARRVDDERPPRRFEDERPARRFEDERPARRVDDERPMRRGDDERPARRPEEPRPTRRTTDDDRPPRRDERPAPRRFSDETAGSSSREGRYPRASDEPEERPPRRAAPVESDRPPRAFPTRRDDDEEEEDNDRTAPRREGSDREGGNRRRRGGRGRGRGGRGDRSD